MTEGASRWTALAAEHEVAVSPRAHVPGAMPAVGFIRESCPPSEIRSNGKALRSNEIRSGRSHHGKDGVRVLGDGFVLKVAILYAYQSTVWF